MIMDVFSPRLYIDSNLLQNAGSNHESTGVYFQAALKFLHGASRLESCGTDNVAHKSIAISRDIYGSTAKLCE